LFKASDVAKGVGFELDLGSPNLTIDADPDLLFQVLINLLRNAAEAAQCHNDLPVVALRFAMTRGRQTTIEVTDNGPGVPEALRQDVFLPFFTTKQKGTGVGLSLARQIILAHRGSIGLETAAGGGALFRLVI
jgi:signal transduction histidine kinase